MNDEDFACTLRFSPAKTNPQHHYLGLFLCQYLFCEAVVSNHNEVNLSLYHVLD